ncbi:serine aminopeptidase domain-containing protein [Marinobacter lacisalsi]|uniref:Serine aminopeptidase domain-containing protein n=1 Tax=Marinobacter lacisalsi TaxID=475979 RepID=A0ABV8QGH0_9GAMM
MSAREATLHDVIRQDIPLTTDGGHRLDVRVFPSTGSRSVVIIAGAMGVNQHCYEKFARFLCDQGHTAITFDYFGTGGSLHTAVRHCPVRVTEWATEDCRALIRLARERFPEQRLQWIGHSVGGQLLGLTPNVNELDNIVTIACGSGYWLENAPPTKRVAWLLWYFLAPASLGLLGYFPGNRLNIVGDLPPNVIRQWRRWCLNPEYAVGAEGPPVREQFASVRVPITTVAFTDDEMMSRRNTESLHGFYCNAPVTMAFIAPADIGEQRIGHLGWFRERFRESLWQERLLPLFA